MLNRIHVCKPLRWQRLRAFDHSRHFTPAIGAAADTQEIPSLHRATDVGDGDLVAAMAAPDVGIIGRIAEYEGEPITATQKRIKQALAARGAKLAIHERMIAGFRCHPIQQM